MVEDLPVVDRRGLGCSEAMVKYSMPTAEKDNVLGVVEGLESDEVLEGPVRAVIKMCLHCLMGKEAMDDRDLVTQAPWIAFVDIS